MIYPQSLSFNNYTLVYKIDFKKFIPAITWFLTVLVLMCLPGDDLPPTDWLNIRYFDKWLHAGVFLLQVVLLCWPFHRSLFKRNLRKYYFIKIAFSVGLWGLVIELIQKFFVAGRSFDLLDWAADSIGALLGFFICSYLFIKRDRTTPV